MTLIDAAANALMRLRRRARTQESAEGPIAYGNSADTLTQFAEFRERGSQGAGDRAGRDVKLPRHEERVEAREAVLAARALEAHRILAAADER